MRILRVAYLFSIINSLSSYQPIGCNPLIQSKILQKNHKNRPHFKKGTTLIMPSQGAGFFACFKSVIGALNYYENYKEQKQLNGIYLEYTSGYYFDPLAGSNWWEYYFEPIFPTSALQGKTIRLTWEEIFKFEKECITTISRERAHELIKKYIKIKPHIWKKVDTFFQQNLQGHFIIGIHYRGTDKSAEAPRVPYEKVFEQLRTILQQQERSSYKIFVATDEQAFLDAIKIRFKNIIYYNSFRSNNLQPVHYTQLIKDPYRRGEEALIDCLLLSKCDLLIRTQSYLSSAATDFNPLMPVVLLNDALYTPGAR